MGDLAKGIKSFKKGMSDDTPSKNEDIRTPAKTFEKPPKPWKTSTTLENY